MQRPAKEFRIKIAHIQLTVSECVQSWKRLDTMQGCPPPLVYLEDTSDTVFGHRLHIRHFPTCDVFAELVVVFPQSLDQLRDAALLNQRHLVVHVLKDEISSGAGGEALNLLVVAVEQLHQLPDAFQTTHLEGQKGKNDASCYLCLQLFRMFLARSYKIMNLLQDIWSKTK